MSYHLLERHLYCYRLCGPNFKPSHPSHQLHMRPPLSAMSVARPSLQRKLQCGSAGLHGVAVLDFEKSCAVFFPERHWQTRRKDQASKHSIHAMFPCFCNEWSDSLFHLISCFSDLWVSRLGSACSVMLHDQARRWQWPSWQWPSYHLALLAQHALSAFRPSQTSLESGSFPTWSCALQRFSEPQDPSGAWYYSSRRVVEEKFI